MADHSHITLYSGGHRGAEAEFGELAERWGFRKSPSPSRGTTLRGIGGAGVGTGGTRQGRRQHGDRLHPHGPHLIPRRTRSARLSSPFSTWSTTATR